MSIGWHTAAEGQGVDVTVRDTGCGIPAAALARVTEPFYTADKSRARAGGGSGMGPALCEKIAALHGGRLQIESVEGEGTAVTVRLPAADGKEGGARQCEQMEEMVRAPRGRGAVHGRFWRWPSRPAPALTLWLGDAGLLAQPHARTQKAGALALTWVRGYVFNAGAEKIQPARKPERLPAGGNQPGFHVLCRAGRLALPCGGNRRRRACCRRSGPPDFMDRIGLSTYQSEDSLGFVNYISYGRRDENLGYYIIGVTVESQSQKVVGLWGTAEEWAGLQEPDAPAVLAAYKTYLGMDSLADWAGPEGTKYAENGLYSASAGLLLALPERVLCCISRLYI